VSRRSRTATEASAEESETDAETFEATAAPDKDDPEVASPEPEQI